MSKLLPCPFCGYPAVITRMGNNRHSSEVECTDCGARLEANEQDWNTGAAWNTRAPLQYTTEPTEAMIEAGAAAWVEYRESMWIKPKEVAERIYRAMLSASPVDTEDSE